MMEWLTQLLLVLPLMKFSNTLPDVIRIGGLFHPADDKQEIAFRYAVEKINSDRMILPRSKLNAQIEKMSPQDSFHASKKARYRYLRQTDKRTRAVWNAFHQQKQRRL